MLVNDRELEPWALPSATEPLHRAFPLPDGEPVLAIELRAAPMARGSVWLRELAIESGSGA
ncbi:MAG: hypothetical protein U1E53_02730 [Dongiaceae bacterium]